MLASEPEFREAEYFAKPAKQGLESPMHQDNFYWNIENAQALNVWIALTRSNKNNGGLCYLEKSHTLGTLNHQIS